MILKFLNTGQEEVVYQENMEENTEFKESLFNKGNDLYEEMATKLISLVLYA